MIHPETHTVTTTHGPRPAGPLDECFYCQAKVGTNHDLTCVFRSRTVVIRAIIEYVVDVPEHWTEDNILFHRNEGSWCASNCVEELKRLTDDSDENDGCICDKVRFEFVRDATPEDDARDRKTNLIVT